MTPTHMTAGELADATGQHPTTVRRHCRQGIIPTAEKSGRDWVITLAAAQAYASTYQRYQRTQSGRPGDPLRRSAAPTTGKTAGQKESTHD